MLIIVRGNSGSGKSTVARALRERLGPNTMLVAQDVIRREILKVKDKPNNPAIDLLFQICSYGQTIGYNVILESILSTGTYAAMLHKLLEAYPSHLVYYFDVSFEETLARHQTKPNAHEFGESEMREWWHEKDFLHIPDERAIPQSLSLEETVDRIIQDYKNQKR